MESTKIQELLLNLLPVWNYQIAKPFKQLLDEGVSLEMYYCIQTLRWGGGTMTMSELAHYTRMPKQQMTKMVNRLVEQEFVERVYDPQNRRIIKIRLTDRALEYINHFLENEASFHGFLSQLNQEDKDKFQQALEMLFEVFVKVPIDFDAAKSDGDFKGE
ncbi:MAG TPA: winged helix DNA-binding protein [Candidatus Gallacutalibacter stercoravium]|nr:winged helix DNA-binding protein [Candidatus Gallacutalibacter stercoravium]